MGKTVWKKLRSRKGASLTFALLAFLVCAVISAVLLASAMATSGRMSKLAETDRRYYAVTSAARLFCDALDGQSFKIERTEVKYSGEENEVLTNENTLQTTVTRRPWIPDPEVHPVTEYSWKITLLTELDSNDKPLQYSDGVVQTSFTNKSQTNYFLADAALTYVMGEYALGSSASTSGAYGTTVGKNSLEWDLVLTATPASAGNTPGNTDGNTDGNTEGNTDGNTDGNTEGNTDGNTEGNTGGNVGDDTGGSTGGTTGGGNESEELQVNVHAKMEKNGSITLTFSNATGTDKFYFTVTLKATVSDNSANPSVTTETDSGIIPDGNYHYTEYTHIETTTVKTTTITWTVAEVGNGKKEASNGTST